MTSVGIRSNYQGRKGISPRNSNRFLYVTIVELSLLSLGLSEFIVLRNKIRRDARGLQLHNVNESGFFMI